MTCAVMTMVARGCMAEGDAGRGGDARGERAHRRREGGVLFGDAEGGHCERVRRRGGGSNVASGSTAGVFVVDWDGPGDPENPKKCALFSSFFLI